MLEVATEDWNLQLSESSLRQELGTEWRPVDKAHKPVRVSFAEQLVNQLTTFESEHPAIHTKTARGWK